MKPADPLELRSLFVCELKSQGSHGFFSRLLAHLLIRLLVVGPLPASLQAWAAFFPVSLLAPLVATASPGGEKAAAEGTQVPQDAWGNFRFPSELNADGDTVAAKNRFAFTGYLWDKETNLFFAKARFYDPEVGRFISQDSYLGQVDDPPSLHRYFYANDNPTRYVDLTGHAAKAKQGYLLGDEPLLVTATDETTVYANPTIAQLEEQFRKGEITQGELVVKGVGQFLAPLASTPDWQKSSDRLAVEAALSSLAFDASTPMLHMMHGAYTNNGGEFALGAAEDVGAAAFSVGLGKGLGAAGDWAAGKFPSLAKPRFGSAPLDVQNPLGLGRPPAMGTKLTGTVNEGTGSELAVDPVNSTTEARPPKVTEPYNRKQHYGRTPTKADRKALRLGPDEVADHEPPLVKRYYEGDSARGEKPGKHMTPAERKASGTDRTRMKAQPKGESDQQGAEMSRYSKGQKKQLLEQQQSRAQTPDPAPKPDEE